MVIVIKRYANRKLYNTKTSQYVTLAEVLALVNGGADVMVIENESKRDITKSTLLSALNQDAENVQFSLNQGIATAVMSPAIGVNENLQLICGKGSVVLHRVQNHAGDVYFRLRAETYQDGRRSCFTLIEYSSEELARTEFSRMTGGV